MDEAQAIPAAAVDLEQVRAFRPGNFVHHVAETVAPGRHEELESAAAPLELRRDLHRHARAIPARSFLATTYLLVDLRDRFFQPSTARNMR